MCMSNLQKHLYLTSGPYGILASASDILEIADYQNALCCESGSAAAHHGKTVVWRDERLPFLSLRACLQLEPDEPHNTLVLQDADGSPMAVLGVDSVNEILTVDEDSLFHFEGIHAELNALFDKLYLDTRTDQLLLHLKPGQQWVSLTLHDKNHLNPDSIEI